MDPPLAGRTTLIDIQRNKFLLVIEDYIMTFWYFWLNHLIFKQCILFFNDILSDFMLSLLSLLF